MAKTAISFKVPPPLWEAFKTQTEELFLSRAPFLDYMVRREVAHLREELSELKLSGRAKRHISGAMKRMGPVSVNIDVAPATADALREVVVDHNLVRDAFMSRLIIFLRSTDALLKHLELPCKATSLPGGASLEEMPASPMRAMEAVRDDPMCYVRSHVEEIWGCGIYRVALPRAMDWAACYLPDDEVTGTAAYRRQSKEIAAMVSLLDGKPAPKRATKSARGAK